MGEKDILDRLVFAINGKVVKPFTWVDLKQEPKTEVIFNDKATILYKDGKKYVCKCDKQDKFSEEFGLALCLLKSFGVSYTEFENLLKSAKRQRKQKGAKL